MNEKLEKIKKKREFQFVEFSIEDELFGINIMNIQEINMVSEITKIPKAPYFVEGIINLRGKVIPVIDIRKRFNLPEKPYDKDTRILVTNLNEKVLSFIVDSVNEVNAITTDNIENPPAYLENVDTKFVTGIAKLEDRIVIILDLNEMFTEEELELLE